MPEKVNKLQLVVAMIAVVWVLALMLVIEYSDRALLYAAVLFGTMFVTLLVGTSVYSRKVSGSSQATPWMRTLRLSQDQHLNAGWRIQLIPYDEPSRPMTMNFSGTLPYLPLVSVLGFFIGFGMLGYDEKKYVIPGCIIMVASWLLGLCGLWLKTRRERAGWDVAPARCVDRELLKVWISLSHGSSRGWLWRIICDYEYLGIPYRVTPNVYWMNFTSEEAAIKFLDERVSASGECTLRVNPKNPLQTELFGQSVKDKLLY